MSTRHRPKSKQAVRQASTKQPGPQPQVKLEEDQDQEQVVEQVTSAFTAQVTKLLLTSCVATVASSR